MTAVAEPIADTLPGARRFTLTPILELVVFGVAVGMMLTTYLVISGNTESQRLLTPPLVALLLVANLVPLVALIVLIGRRVAMRRAARSVLGGRARLHVRLVAIFSILASVPTIFVSIVASLLFQYGVEFWYSDRARSMLENASTVAAGSFDDLKERVGQNADKMAFDVAGELLETPIDAPRFTQFFAFQTQQRELSEAALLREMPSGEFQTLVILNPYEALIEQQISRNAVRKIKAGASGAVVEDAGGRVRALIRLPQSSDLYLYVARVVDPVLLDRKNRAESVVSSYRTLTERSRTLQLQFNIALLVLSLLIVGLAVWVALEIADRLVRPVGDLVKAARDVAEGDLGTRVPTPKSQDEIGILATAFNRMTDRLQEQTNALVAANAQSESRRALIEAVMSGVTAGVVSIDADRRIRVINSSAMALLNPGEAPVGRLLSDVAPELDQLLGGEAREDIVQLATGGEARTLAVKITRDEGGQVLTFDDITQQLLDQRRAAWSDVARRIAHEIKNPLTPIQLAAERLQRRYGKQVDAEDGTFAKLTDTIVRQVGDLRRMVDEFSSFARMPKPIFREESVLDIARQTMFLHEVAKPEIRYTLTHPDPVPALVCDRRQLGQALTNLVKNATEAVEMRTEAEGEGERGLVEMTIRAGEPGQLLIDIDDNGIGLPAERERIVEPYMTTRARGTGLGLAIVKKIVEEHFGTMTFADRPGGGTRVTLCFDMATLERLAGTGGEDGSDEPGGAMPAGLTRTKNG
ncbi:HAMP domain-containing protein [Sphingomonas koreensis]|jgi:two-component system nitrogen regulation sensor histidine kinase NtrY|uniref:histidine kinase n=1 Tax=Sphingomonas koreensis TaxID=93064 RepID=A0A1L6JC05_9SPHN|nr:ATP-binding protein [Sphingomonas koreensis]APR53406.1 PAS domain-containing sensor histidine kinase [Sphingomonas koreensis]MDC7809906.1 ATP-binding protein [Sphingomonas koreensis]RSU24469.1 HAMP domain-containing protein [Sphingomonas koreensis]RSU25114.1 HAMP domain-containing protein [Sphingomonas koreensis]RSU30211.1 HAMP domain-containing protein [Sphingomonas koreensis]